MQVLNFQAEAFAAIQEAAEKYLVKLLSSLIM